MTRKLLALTCMLPLATALAYGRSNAQPSATSTAPAAAASAPAKPVHAAQDPGDRVYQANCARCHSAPEELSPRVTPTVVMHMRVRANLSAKDQQLLLKYLAP